MQYILQNFLPYLQNNFTPRHGELGHLANSDFARFSPNFKPVHVISSRNVELQLVAVRISGFDATHQDVRTGWKEQFDPRVQHDGSFHVHIFHGDVHRCDVGRSQTSAVGRFYVENVSGTFFIVERCDEDESTGGGIDVKDLYKFVDKFGG